MISRRQIGRSAERKRYFRPSCPDPVSRIGLCHPERAVRALPGAVSAVATARDGGVRVSAASVFRE